MKLDVNVLRYLSKEDFRVLTAVEMGMRNHQIVPAELIDRIAGLKHGGTYKVLKNLLKHKLVHHDSSKYDGFRLTYLGYDFLAIKALVNRGVFVSVGRQIGVGKESDIFEVATEDGTVLAMKLHRLGRVSFRAVKSKRDYLLHRSSYNWLYLSRLAALKEFAFMEALKAHGFPVPAAVDCNRHCVIMSLVQGYPLVQVKQLQNPETVFETIIGLVVRLAEKGLIHCDFNEFNIMIEDDEKVTLIDFPQMVSVSHRNAQMYFDRDVECIFKFFRKRFNLSFHVDQDESGESEFDESGRPRFFAIMKSTDSLDKELAASGFTTKDQDVIEKFIEGGIEQDSENSGDEEIVDEGCLPADIDDTVVYNLNSLHLHGCAVRHDVNDEMQEKQYSNEVSHSNEPETPQVSEKNESTVSCDAKDEKTLNQCFNQASDSNEPEALQSEKEDNEGACEGDDAGLMKRLNKQRQKAIAAARGGRRAISSRNSYKDKGSKSSHNAKIQKQLNQW
ncbi:hypothetical protein AAC387_Pa05g0501 [Persea americana]|eukprot:TRINITY_DN986_c0_g1_i4.p1 TRINITY_DN986_c0_g1~~TRINITY_DN986_c0_g1_i4.p1  ORF type:complete len:503 (+),score=118.91 TRINITY_DN986_c0_g1_i4:219-1727(+)